MAWIEWIQEDEARGRLNEIFEKYTTRHGGVDHILKIHSLNPESLDLHYAYYSHIMRGKSGLSRAEREMIGVAVSRANECFY